MTVDISKIRPGDEVTVRFIVTEIKDHDVFLSDRMGSGPLVDAPTDRIVSHTPKAPSVGDMVQVNFAEGPIVAIHGRYAWVDLGAPDGHPSTWILSDLERIS